MNTSDFPAWASSFASHFERVRVNAAPSIHQFEALFTRWIAQHLLASRDDGAHSRKRCWPLRLVFWTFLWQVAQAGASCREAIRQAQSLCQRYGDEIPSIENSPYCQARGNLPIETLEDIHRAIVREAGLASAPKDLWLGHRVHVVDGTTVTMPDTSENQAVYPQQSVQKPGCGFPIMRIVALFSLATGMLSAWATGNWYQSEIGLLQNLWECFQPGDILLGDRFFSGWAILAQCVDLRINGVFRVHGARKVDMRRGQRIGHGERIVKWEKPKVRPTYLSAEQWAQFPAELSVRIARCRMNVRGFRSQEIFLVTTLLDPKKYPASELGALYRRRWEMELTLRNIKTTLQMDQLSCKNPNNIERELRMHFLMHNLVRRLMLEAARQRNVSLSRVSFAGALSAARRYAEAMLQATTKRLRRELFEEMIRILAEDKVPFRPGRREPRAVKRRPKPYPLLNKHRKIFNEIRHQNRYRAPRRTKMTGEMHGVN